jgi:hypothetical protein
MNQPDQRKTCTGSDFARSRKKAVHALLNEGDPKIHLVIKIDAREALDNSPEPLETMKEVAEVFLTHPDDIGDGQFLDTCRGRRPSGVA